MLDEPPYADPARPPVDPPVTARPASTSSGDRRRIRRYALAATVGTFVGGIGAMALHPAASASTVTTTPASDATTSPTTTPAVRGAVPATPSVTTPVHTESHGS